MLTLTSYQGVVQNGVIRLRDVRLPEGAQVVVVVAETQTLSVDEQLQRLQARPLDDRQRRFDELADHVSQHQAEVDIDTRPARLRRQAADKVCTHSHSAPLRGQGSPILYFLFPRRRFQRLQLPRGHCRHRGRFGHCTGGRAKGHCATARRAGPDGAH